MKNFFGVLGRFCKLIATGTTVLFLAACYGPVYTGQKVTAVTSDGKPVPGLLFSNTDGQTDYEEFTGSDGSVYLYVGFNEAEYTVEDVDGVENLGEFKNTTLTVIADGFEQTITMQKK